MTVTSRIEGPGPFTGLRVAVTGGTSGLGLALVRELLGRGALVAFVARDRERVERVARAAGGHVLSLDPGDMDTPLHALAVPGADRATLKRPEAAARELADAIAAALPRRGAYAACHGSI